MTNPLRLLLDERLPEMDVGVMEHGFAQHGRDYVFVLEDSISNRPGTYRLTLTHVVELHLTTAVDADVWQRSWSDEFINYAGWEAAGEPDGYVFGTNWSLAYPGLHTVDDDPNAASWSAKLGRPMHAASLHTDRFKISLVFHGVKLEQVGDRAPTVSQVIIPMS